MANTEHLDKLSEILQTRIVEGINDLMSKEDFQRELDTRLRAFFTDIKTTNNYGNTSVAPSLFSRIVEEHFTKQIDAFIKQELENAKENKIVLKANGTYAIGSTIMAVLQNTPNLLFEEYDRYNQFKLAKATAHVIGQAVLNSNSVNTFNSHNFGAEFSQNLVTSIVRLIEDQNREMGSLNHVMGLDTSPINFDRYETYMNEIRNTKQEGIDSVKKEFSKLRETFKEEILSEITSKYNLVPKND